MAVSKRLRFEILRRDNHACRYCGRAAPEVKLTVDHVTPEALGGRTEAANLVTACSDCNGGKTSIAPDSAIVDDVAEDALRWSRAITRAADHMLADLEARQARRDEFLTAWNGWKYSGGEFVGQPVPLPPDWMHTIDRFLAAGLPMAVLLDCVGAAMAKERVRDEFRYLCGVAWNRINQLQETARATVSNRPAPPDSVPPPTAERLAEILIGIAWEGFTQHHRDEWMRLTREDLDMRHRHDHAVEADLFAQDYALVRRLVIMAVAYSQELDRVAEVS